MCTQVLCEQDKKAIEYFAQHYEIDFISLSYTRSKEDLLEAREFADRVGLATTKVCWWQTCVFVCV